VPNSQDAVVGGDATKSKPDPAVQAPVDASKSKMQFSWIIAIEVIIIALIIVGLYLKHII
jgi:hypothetical protein